MKMKYRRFLFQKKRNSKIKAWALSVPVFNKKNYRLLFKNPCPRKRYTFEKNEKQTFSMQYIFIWNKSAYLPHIFALLNQALCGLNCDHDSSYVDVAYVLSIFSQFWK